MSYAILRNENYKKENLARLYKHNERKNTNYSNKNINKDNSINNYSIKKCTTTYQKAITNLINKYNMKNRITKQTNLICEFIITSDKEFFEHIEIEKLKKITNYELQQFEKHSIQKETVTQTNNIELLQKENKRIIKKYNTLSNQYVKIRNNVYMIQKINKKIQNEKNNLQFENKQLKEENQKFKKENHKLKDYIEKALDYVNLLFNFPKITLKRLIDKFDKEFNERN